jgi:hypothetical protein
MARPNLLGVLVVVSLAAGCGGSPSAPSSTSGKSSLGAESAVMSAVSQAMGQLALVGPTIGDPPNTFTMPCANGGSIVTILDPLPPQEKTVFRYSSRTEFRDCRNAAGTINGDPYLQTTAEHSFPTPAGTGGDSISTLRSTGGLRFDMNGVQGRIQFNCTMTVNIGVANGVTQSSATWSGTTTFEQPLGTTPVTRPCGPA